MDNHKRGVSSSINSHIYNMIIPYVGSQCLFIYFQQVHGGLISISYIHWYYILWPYDSHKICLLCTKVYLKHMGYAWCWEMLWVFLFSTLCNIFDEDSNKLVRFYAFYCCWCYSIWFWCICVLVEFCNGACCAYLTCTWSLESWYNRSTRFYNVSTFCWDFKLCDKFWSE